MTLTERVLKNRTKRAELREQFPAGDCLMISLANNQFNLVGGLVMEVSVDQAAQHILENTHRLCTVDEAKTFRAAQDQARKTMKAAEPSRGVVYVTGDKKARTS